MSDYVGSIFKRPAQHWSRECVVDHKRHTVAVGDAGKLLYVKHFHSRIGEGLTEQELGLGSEGGADLFLGRIRGDECHLDSHFRKRGSEQVESPSVDVAGADYVVSSRADIQACEKVRRLA